MFLTHIVNGHPPPDLHIGKLEFTINTLVSLATEFAKISMTATVVSLLAQLKWLWLLEKPGRLSSLRVHHDATQGPWGSLMLLVEMEGRYAPIV